MRQDKHNSDALVKYLTDATSAAMAASAATPTPTATAAAESVVIESELVHIQAEEKDESERIHPTQGHSDPELIADGDLIDVAIGLGHRTAEARQDNEQRLESVQVVMVTTLHFNEASLHIFQQSDFHP